MKEGWTTRKFSDIFDLQMGKTPSRDNSSYWGGTNTWVSIADMNCGKYIYDTKEHITNSAVSESGIYRVSKDTVIMSFKLSIGKTAIATKDLYTNEAIMSFNTKEGFEILPDYIYYYLKGYKWQGMNKAVMGMTLNKKAISNNIFSYPNTLQQQHIVEELDLLSSIIEKKKAQLKELDNLAQSLFYEMFGDPITNEKGWEVKKLGEICSFSQGIQVDVSKQSTEKITGWNRFLRIVDYTTENDDIRYVNVNDPKYILNKEDIAMVRYGASVGTSDIGKEGVLANNLFKINYSKYVFNKYYLLYSFHTMYFKAFIHTVSFGAAMPALSFKVMKDFQLLQPPLSCQQSFASKIEAIECQKELIKQSIKEVETLFNSRMDYYFN